MSKVVLFKVSELASAADAISISQAKFDKKAVVADLMLAEKDIQSVGGMCVDNSGNIYVSDDVQHIVLKVTEGGKISVLAGKAGVSGNNGSKQGVPSADARFNQPKGLACDNSGNVYVADYGNNQIRLIRNGKVDVFAGNGAGISGLVDANLDPFQSRFSHPSDVAVDASGIVYVADTDNNAIRKIWGAKVLTIAGGGATADAENIQASKNTPFCDEPVGIAVDRRGTIYVCDKGNNKIKKITANGWIYLHSGSGVAGKDLGRSSSTPAYACEYEGLKYIAVDSYGYQYVTDVAVSGSRLVKVDPNGVPSNVINFENTDVDGGIEGVAVTPAGKVFVSANVIPAP
jgi:serine/threonine protein kinase, bacterial